MLEHFYHLYLINCIFKFSFMYTGQLEYWTSEQHALYRTAQKMNMTVLTKLLDAQFNTSKVADDVTKTPTRPMIAVSKPSTPTTKTIVSSTSSASTLSGQPLPGRKYVFLNVIFQPHSYKNKTK